MRIFLIVAVALVWFRTGLSQADDDLARRVVIVYNAQAPGSRLLAEYYASRRGVPTNQICSIWVRASETITRKEFNNQIQEPIRRFLSRNGLILQTPRVVDDPILGQLATLITVRNKICVLVLMRGVPLRIADDPSVQEKIPGEQPSPGLMRNEASVESDLALVPTMGLPISTPLRNQFFDAKILRFEPPLNNLMMLVGRLDGPDDPTVKRLIDDALATERHGLHGRAYFDLRSITDKGYAEGDEWISGAERVVREAGFECETDTDPDTFDDDYPMTDVAVYAGWYAGNLNGPFRQEAFRFRRGAVPYHIHSASGASLHTTKAYWVGPLLAKGAAATMGNVFEPYLSLTPRADLFFNRLLAGVTFLEAGYCSQPVLSWQTTFVGDPLYRPFALSLGEQIASMEVDKDPDLEWAYLRKTNQLILAGQIHEAEELCRAKAELLNSRVLYEKLGDMLMTNNQPGKAVAAYDRAGRNPPSPNHRIRIAGKLARAHEANHQPALAITIYEAVADACPSNRNARKFLQAACEVAKAMDDDEQLKKLQAKLEKFGGPIAGSGAKNK